MVVDVNGLKLGGNNPLFLIAGPCVIEDEKSLFEIALQLKTITQEEQIPFIFKTSYDKANRLSIKSYRGPGLKKGLKILARLKKVLGLTILVDVHSPEEARASAEIVDILQIPAFLCRQTDLTIACAKTKRVVNIKKGQFLSPWDMKYLIEKIVESGNERVLLTERGTTFGFGNLVVDMRSIAIMKSFGYPVVFDAGHSTQMPGAKGGKSGGMRDMIPVLARAGVAAGCDGLFIEVHKEPKKALSDPYNQLKLSSLKKLLKQVKLISRILKEEA